MEQLRLRNVQAREPLVRHLEGDLWETAGREPDEHLPHLADAAFRRVYEEEAAKMELWVQLVEARQQAGLTQKQLAERLGVTQAQVARIEKGGYDAYTVTSLRRYVAALGEEFSLTIEVRHHDRPVDETFGRVTVAS